MILLVDISGLVYRTAHKVKLSVGKANTGMIFGVMRSLSALAHQLEPTQMILCFDAGRQARSDMYPEYKANRKRDPDFKQAVDEQLAVLGKIIACLPIIKVACPGVEADDVIAHLADHLKGQPIGIITSDKDLHQLATRTTKIFGYDGSQVELTMKPAQVVAWKVLVGDSSDNIKGVLGLGAKTADRLLAEHGSLKNIVKWARQGNKLGRMHVDDALPIIKRNLDLIRLDGRLLTEDQKLHITSSYDLELVGGLKVDAEGLGWVFKQLQFNSLISKFQTFLAPFRMMEQ